MTQKFHVLNLVFSTYSNVTNFENSTNIIQNQINTTRILYNQISKSQYCWPERSNLDKYYTISKIVIFLFIPLLMIILSYSLIISRLLKQRNKMNRLFSKSNLDKTQEDDDGKFGETSNCFSDASNLNTASTQLPQSTFRESSSDVFASSPIKTQNLGNRPLALENSLGEDIKQREQMAKEHREKIKTRAKLRSVSDDNRIKRITKLSGKLVLVFLICWLPNMMINVLQVLEVGNFFTDSHTMTVFCEILAYSSAAINPMIYAFDSSEHFRKTLKSCFNK